MKEQEREWLELAAKAAGYDFEWYCRGADNPYGKPDVPCVNGSEWNPLESDKQALALSYDLKINIEYTDKMVYTRCSRNWPPGTADGQPVRIFMEEYDADDPRSEVRRAIVRAAAALIDETV